MDVYGGMNKEEDVLPDGGAGVPYYHRTSPRKSMQEAKDFIQHLHPNSKLLLENLQCEIWRQLQSMTTAALGNSITYHRMTHIVQCGIETIHRLEPGADTSQYAKTLLDGLEPYWDALLNDPHTEAFPKDGLTLTSYYVIKMALQLIKNNQTSGLKNLLKPLDETRKIHEVWERLTKSSSSSSRARKTGFLSIMTTDYRVQASGGFKQKLGIFTILEYNPKHDFFKDIPMEKKEKPVVETGGAKRGKVSSPQAARGPPTKKFKPNQGNDTESDSDDNPEYLVDDPLMDDHLVDYQGNIFKADDMRIIVPKGIAIQGADLEAEDKKEGQEGGGSGDETQSESGDETQSDSEDEEGPEPIVEKKPHDFENQDLIILLKIQNTFAHAWKKKLDAKEYVRLLQSIANRLVATFLNNHIVTALHSKMKSKWDDLIEPDDKLHNQILFTSVKTILDMSLSKLDEMDIQWLLENNKDQASNKLKTYDSHYCQSSMGFYVFTDNAEIVTLPEFNLEDIRSVSSFMSKTLPKNMLVGLVSIQNKFVEIIRECDGNQIKKELDKVTKAIEDEFRAEAEYFWVQIHSILLHCWEILLKPNEHTENHRDLPIFRAVRYILEALNDDKQTNFDKEKLILNYEESMLWGNGWLDYVYLHQYIGFYQFGKNLPAPRSPSSIHKTEGVMIMPQNSAAVIPYLKAKLTPRLLKFGYMIQRHITTSINDYKTQETKHLNAEFLNSMVIHFKQERLNVILAQRLGTIMNSWWDLLLAKGDMTDYTKMIFYATRLVVLSAAHIVGNRIYIRKAKDFLKNQDLTTLIVKPFDDDRKEGFDYFQ